MSVSSLGGQTPNLTTNPDGRVFRTRKLRDKIGPDDPMYHLLMLEAKRDVFSIFDDFLTAIDNTGNTEIFWNASTNGGSAPTQLTAAGDINGVIDFPTGAGNDQDSILFSEEVFTADHRPVALFRTQMRSTIANGKFELGFIDADPGVSGENAGAVLVKATPTSTATDYAVVVYDTDDDTSVDLQTDGGDSTVASVVSSPGFSGTLSTFVTQTWYDIMIAVNEQGEVRFWVDSTFRGVIRGTSANDTGPDIDLETLGIWAFCQSRNGTETLLYMDYILAWQERIRLPRAID